MALDVKFLGWNGLVLAFFGVLAYGVWSVLERNAIPRAGSLPVLKATPVPEFELTECDGRTVTQADLLGKIWLANFVFTRCTGPCPELSLRMRSIQQALKEYPPDLRLVTFTLDPQSDTSEVLAAYADRFQADPARWWFLTGGDERAMHRLIREGFLQTVIPESASGPLTHSEYFVLLDRASRIRAVYDGRDPESKPRILHDMDSLLGEHNSP